MTLTQRQRFLVSFLMGLAGIGALASHWIGYFVQLYLVAYVGILFVRHREQWIRNALLMTAGWSVGVCPWWLLVGNDLWYGFVFSLINGGLLVGSLQIGYTYYLYPYTNWPGGTLVIVGLMLYILTLGTESAARLWYPQRVNHNNGPSKARQVELFLLFNLAAYAGFFAAFVANRHPQYGIHIYWIVLIIAARGYIMILELALKWMSIPDIAHYVAAAGMVLVLWNSPQVGQFQGFSLIRAEDPNQVYTEVRSGFASLLPSGVPIVLGANAYPYLYDYNYVSAVSLIMQRVLPSFHDLSFIARIKQQFKQQVDYRGQKNPSSLAVDDWTDLLNRSGDDIYIGSPSVGLWDDLFYNPHVWRNDFVEVATIFIHDPKSNGSSPDQQFWEFSAYITNFSRLFTIYVRKDKAEKLFSACQLSTNTFWLGRHAGILVRDPFNQTLDNQEIGDWNNLRDDEKSDRIARYFDGRRWFGMNLDGAKRKEFVAALRPQVDGFASFFNALGRPRTLGQAIDYAFTYSAYSLRLNDVQAPGHSLSDIPLNHAGCRVSDKIVDRRHL
jgi:hypothetical protein